MKVKRSIILILCFLLTASLFSQQKVKEKDLPEKYQDWLKLTRYIIHDRELDVFMQLTNNRDRDIFIESFWNLRDPTPGTPKNERKDEIIERFEYANYRLGSGAGRPGWMTDKGRIYMILGPPVSIERNPSSQEVFPNELWSYYGDINKGLPSHFVLVFFRRGGAGELKLYDPVSDGPDSLLIFGRDMDHTDYEALYEKIRDVQPILALSSLSIIPGEAAIGFQPSLDSTMIMANILESAKNEVTPTYATHFLDYKGIVDTEYMTNFIESEAQIDVIKDPISGLNFLHFSILPSEISVDYYEPNDQYYSDLRIDVSLRVQDRIIFQYSKDFPLYFSDDDLRQMEASGISIEDSFPLADGDYKFIVLLQNSVAREFSIIEKELSIPEDLGVSKISGPFFGFKIINLDESYHIPYKILDKKLAVDPKNTFGTSDDLVFFFNIENLTQDLWKSGEVKVSIKGTTGEKPYEKNYALDLSRFTFNKTLFLSQSLPASEFVPDYYYLDLTFLDQEGQTVDLQSGHFIISPLKSVAHPNPKIKGIPLQNQFIHYFMLAQQYENLNNVDKAEANYAKAYGLKPDYTKGLIDYANFTLNQNKFDKTLELIETAKDNEEYKFNYYLIKGKALMGLGRYSEAIVE
ncbi:MAG: GWxTD domain-containing protein, partial [Candidatus Aminicenantes bacterium]|nr:GWxTD domain-containing protein [Candidatus Aminicenantes bacterium]